MPAYFLIHHRNIEYRTGVNDIELATLEWGSGSIKSVSIERLAMYRHLSLKSSIMRI